MGCERGVPLGVGDGSHGVCGEGMCVPEKASVVRNLLVASLTVCLWERNAAIISRSVHARARTRIERLSSGSRATPMRSPTG
jgi:hypothetical protein